MEVISTTRRPIKIDGHEFFASPLTDNAKDSLDQFVQHKLIEGKMAFIDRLEKQEDREFAIKTAMEQVAGVGFMSAEGVNIAGSPEGIARIIWEGVRPNHPDWPWERFKELEFDVTALAEGNAIFYEFNVAPLEKAKREGKERRAKATKEKRAKAKKLRSQKKKSTKSS